jgi:thiol-disulfide isomerase/thioredoxin
VAALVLLASTLSAAAQAAEPDKIKLGEFIPAATPQPAPEISLADRAGNPVALADFNGKFLVLNLWATWCAPCLNEMPSLERLQAKFGPALTVIAVSEDRGGDKVVAPFVADHQLDKLRIYLDPSSAVSHAFAVRGLPTTLVIDANGRVLGKVEGEADWDSATMQAVLASLMPVNSPGR